MPGQDSGRQERWLWIAALAVLAAIYSTLRLARTLERALGHTGLGVELFIVGVVLVLAAIVTQGLRVRPRGIEIGFGLAIAAAYTLVFARMAAPAERTHLAEYGVLAILIHEALRERARRGGRVPVPGLLAVLAASLAGLVDEGIQFFIPARTFDPRDILFNVFAGVMAVSANTALGWARTRARRDRQRSANQTGRDTGSE